MIEHLKGNVVVSSIGTVVDHPDVKIWEVRLRTEYPDVTVYEGGHGAKGQEPYVGVWLSAKATSQNPDRRYTLPTELRFKIPDDSETWRVFAQRDTTSSSVRIAAYRKGVVTYA